MSTIMYEDKNIKITRFGLGADRGVAYAVNDIEFLIKKLLNKTKTVAQVLVSAIQARENCYQSNNEEWKGKWDDLIDRIIKNGPSGSGIDNGTKLHTQSFSGKHQLEWFSVRGDYHHMDEQGGYDGWTEHEICVLKGWDGVELKIRGKNRNDIKDYLYEVYDYWLNSECKETM